MRAPNPSSPQPAEPIYTTSRPPPLQLPQSIPVVDEPQRKPPSLQEFLELKKDRLLSTNEVAPEEVLTEEEEAGAALDGGPAPHPSTNSSSMASMRLSREGILGDENPNRASGSGIFLDAERPRRTTLPEILLFLEGREQKLLIAPQVESDGATYVPPATTRLRSRAEYQTQQRR